MYDKYTPVCVWRCFLVLHLNIALRFFKLFVTGALAKKLCHSEQSEESRGNETKSQLRPIRFYKFTALQVVSV